MRSLALIFDLDGTLVDSVPDLRAALNQMLAGVNCRELTALEVRAMIGDGTRALVARALAAAHASAEFETAHERFLEIYEAAPARLSQLYAGVAETIGLLSASGAQLAVCTNKPQAATLGVLEAFQITKYFDAIVGGDVTSFRKPDPRHLLATLRQLRSAAGEAVMIGDNENDYAAARAATLPIILMRYGYLRVAPETLAPDAWLDRFGEIPDALKRLTLAT